MEFSFDEPSRRGSPVLPSRRPTDQTSASNQDAIGSDRLRKAIARNRAKQARRMGNDEKVVSASSRPSSTSSSMRKSVASQDHFEFSSDIRRGTHRAPAPVAYQTPVVSKSLVPARTTKKVTATKPSRGKRKSLIGDKTQDYLSRGVWVFCGFLILRLIFSGGGVIDYYDKLDHLKRRELRQNEIVAENEQLKQEIDSLRHDPLYQKKVVRDLLGYIAKDEFLILFTE